MIKKADIILFIIILAAGLIVSFLPLADAVGQPQVKVTVAGETYGIYALDEDRTVEISQDTQEGTTEVTNVLVIQGGECWMESASCHNQICVNHGHISEPGDLIVCLPNKVVVEIVGGSQEGGGVDVVSN